MGEDLRLLSTTNLSASAVFNHEPSAWASRMRAIVVAPLSPNTMPTASFVANASPPTPSLRGYAHALVTKTRFARDTKTFTVGRRLHENAIAALSSEPVGVKGLSI